MTDDFDRFLSAVSAADAGAISSAEANEIITSLNLKSFPELDSAFDEMLRMLESLNAGPGTHEGNRLAVLNDLGATASSIAVESGSEEAWRALREAFAAHAFDLQHVRDEKRGESWKLHRLSPTIVLDSLLVGAYADHPLSREYAPIYARSLLEFAEGVARICGMGSRENQVLLELKYVLVHFLQPLGIDLTDLDAVSQRWPVKEMTDPIPEPDEIVEAERRAAFGQAYANAGHSEVPTLASPEATARGRSPRATTPKKAPGKRRAPRVDPEALARDLDDLDRAHRVGAITPAEYQKALTRIQKRHATVKTPAIVERRKAISTVRAAKSRPRRAAFWLWLVVLAAIPIAALSYLGWAFSEVGQTTEPHFENALKIAIAVVVVYVLAGWMWAYNKDPQFTMGLTKLVLFSLAAAAAVKSYKDHERKEDATAMADELERRGLVKDAR